jgi:hypothetical protein
MERCVSKDHNIALKEIFSSDVPPVDVRANFRAAMSAVNTSKFNNLMTFNEFYKLVDAIARERHVTLKSAYATCPPVVHDYLSLRSAEHGYQEFKEGQVNDEWINRKISFIILRSLYYARPSPNIISDEFDTEDPDEISLHSLHTYIDKNMRQSSLDLERVYRHVSAEVREEYPKQKAIKDFKRYLSGKNIKAVISFDAAESILHVLQNFQLYERLSARKIETLSTLSPLISPVVIPVVNKPRDEEDRRLERNSILLKEYREKFNALRDIKQAPLAAVWFSLPSETVKGHSYLSYRNGSCIGSDRNNLSMDVCNTILDVYHKLPDYTSRVIAYEVNGPFVLGENFGLMMSSKVAYEQIKEAQKEFGARREAIISKFSELTGRPEDSRLLVKKHGRDKCISRLQVAIIMSIIESKDVPEEAVILLNHYLDNTKLIEPSEKRAASSSGLKFQEDGMLVKAFNDQDKSNRLVKLSTRASPSSVTSEMVMALE